MLRVDGIHEKEQITFVMRKLRAVMHAIIFAAGCYFCNGCMEGEEPNRTDEGAIEANKVR